jgi:apolipoprotein N-acyltransferase
MNSLTSSTSAASLQVGIVQPSIDPWIKWRGGIADMIHYHQHLQDSLNRVHHCDLSAWSETAIPVGLRLPENQSLLNELRAWVDTSHTALLTGYADYEFFPAGSAPPNAQAFSLDPGLMMRIYNAAGIIAPNINDIPTHHKSKLTPFGEYMPFSDDFPFVQSWLKWGVGISGWNKGEGANALPLRRGADTLARIGPVICIESIYPNYVADYVRHGADMLAVITNDAWYDGTFGPEQHYCISRMRAVETRREIMRCGNSGVSGFISATGESTFQAEPRKALAFAGAVHRRNDISVYVRFGDWLPQLSALFAAVMMLWLRIFGKRRLTTS